MGEPVKYQGSSKTGVEGCSNICYDALRGLNNLGEYQCIPILTSSLHCLKVVVEVLSLFKHLSTVNC